MAWAEPAGETRELAVVVGASRGIGLMIARSLARSGRMVRVVARDAERVEAAAAELRAEGLEVEARVADATSADEVARALVPAPGQRLTVCVAATGRNLSRSLLSTDRNSGAVRVHGLDEWESTITTNLTTTFLVGRAAAQVMAATPGPGVIVTIASASWRGSRGQAAYAAAKAGVVSLTRSWAKELAGWDIRVVGVAPGVVDGAALREKCAARPRHAAFMEGLREQVPLGRFAQEEEIAATVLHAVENEYINGTTLEVDGGGM